VAAVARAHRDVAAGGARETAREGEAQAGARRGSGLGRTAAHTGRENGLDLVRRHAGAVVVDRYQHSAVAPLDVYVYASAGERTGVLYQRLQHAHGDLGLDAESKWWRGSLRLDLQPSALGKRRAGVRDLVENVARVTASARQTALLLGGGHQRLDGARHLLCVGHDGRQSLPILLGLSFAPQGQLGLGAHLREGRAQLVRHLGGEALLAAQAGGQSVEQAVERRGELAQLVVRFAHRKAPVQVVLAPRSGVRVRVLTTPLEEDGKTLAVFSIALSEEPMLVTLRQLRLTLLVLLPLAAAVAALLGYLLTRRMLRPLARMQATAAEISSHDLSRRLGAAAGDDEVSQLAATFDAMLDRLEASFVRERRFVADASHELRTPLAALQAIVSVTREWPRSAEEYEQALDDVDGETARLRTLVENLLELARGDVERLAEREPIDVSGLLGDVCASLEVLAADKGLRLSCELEDGLVVEGDGDALVRLFVNVLDNAIKYTDGGGVDVAGVAADGAVAVTVRDSGRGVPAEQLPHLFERFYRGDASRSAEGSGLGLAIARLIAEAHGGTIAISSGEGRGTTCEVRLPAAAAGPALPPLPASRAR
jgi:heavy metal sensor kinase